MLARLAIPGLLILTFSTAGAEELEAKKVSAVTAADEIVNMRSSLAQAFIKPDMEITEETFKNVCGAVAKRVKEISEKEGFRIRQAAVKNRNPNHEAKPDEVKVLESFDKDRNLKDKWDSAEMEGKRYQRYMRPIFVEEACLACHGPKEKRPRFIVEKYPNDKAYDFKVGDLRGMIEVMIEE
jgi:hypothetical protein